jgi:hypothetical protein
MSDPDMPIMQCKPGPTDDDIEFQNDMDYLRALLSAIVMATTL